MEKYIRYFSAYDSFNDNQLEGYISQYPDHRYGSLLLQRVNGKEVEQQLIYGTPKIHYPFGVTADGTRQYHWPPLREARFYQKYDGTNIFAYCYTAEGRVYTTYKTRLQPVLMKSGWGDWPVLWQQMIQRYPCIPALPQLNGCGISFELFGSQNHHLVSYDTPLDIVALFGVGNDGKIISPKQIQTHQVPTASLLDYYSGDSYTKPYEQWREKIGERNRDRIVEEGIVVYGTDTKGTIHLFKLKPADIEEIHWANHEPNKDIIHQACVKIVENSEKLSLGNVLDLLGQDWEPQVLHKYLQLIGKEIALTKGEMEFKNSVIKLYKELGLSIEQDKKETMRTLSQYFEKGQMNRIYSILKEVH